MRVRIPPGPRRRADGRLNLRRGIAAIVVATLVAAGACEQALFPVVDAAGEWQLEAGVVDGRPVPTLVGHPVTMRVEPDRVSGSAGCNSYGALLRQDGASFRLTDLSGTAAGCEPAVMDLESSYMEALARVTHAARVDGRLLLTGGNVELRYLAVAPIQPSGLVDTDWVLQSLVTGDVASSAAGEAATLALASDGTFTASTGCRDLRGRYVIEGSNVLVVEMAANGTCPPELEAQDAHVVEVLGDGFRATVEGTTLTVADPGGKGLVYAARE